MKISQAQFFKYLPKNRWVLGLALLLPAAWLTYILAILILLDTSLLQFLTHMNNEEFQLKYKIAWSFIPGKVEIRGATMHFQDQNVEMHFKYPNVSARFDLKGFTKKLLRLTELKVKGLTYEIRLKTDEEKKVYPNSPNPRSMEERRRDIWRTRFENVEITEIESVNLNGIFLTGKMKASGQFSIWPSVEVEVGPAHFELEEGSLGIKKPEQALVPFGENVHGTLALDFTKFIVPETSGAKVLRHLNAHAKFDAKIENMRFLNKFLEVAPSVRLDGGAGPLNLEIDIKKGFVQHPSTIHIPSPKVILETFGYALQGKGDVLWNTYLKKDSSVAAMLKAKLDSFDMTLLQSADVLVHGENLSATANTSDLDLVNPFTNLYLHLIIPKANAPDLTRFSKILKGRAALQTDLTAFAGQGVCPSTPGQLHLQLQETSFRFKESYIQADGKLSIFLEGIDLQKMRGKLASVRADLRNIGVKNEDGKKEKEEEPWWLRVELKKGEFSLAKGHKMKGEAQIHMKDIVLPLTAIGVEAKLSGLQKFILPKGEAKLKTFIEADTESALARDITASTSGLDARGELKLGSNGVNGAVILRVLHILPVGISFKDSKPDVTFPASDDWLKEKKP